MEQKNSKIFSKETMQTVSAFCDDENIKDIDNFIYLCFKQGFDIKRYGLLGKTLNDGEKDLKTGSIEEKQVIKEVIVEKRVEIPVEVIKEVEKIVEVIKEVEKIVEVPVEKVVTKIEYISDKSGENELLLKIQQLENEMSKKDEELAELRRSLDISKQNDGGDRVKLLQDTIVNLNTEIRNLKKQIKELENKTFQQPQTGEYVKARFHGSSNLND
jgi:DNA-binding protein YbaB